MAHDPNEEDLRRWHGRQLADDRTGYSGHGSHGAHNRQQAGDTRSGVAGDQFRGHYGNETGHGPMPARPLGWDDHRAAVRGTHEPAAPRNAAQGSQAPHRDPEYQQWREAQLRQLDADYDSWRKERYQNFPQDFDAWRSKRAAAAAGTPEAEPGPPEKDSAA